MDATTSNDEEEKKRKKEERERRKEARREAKLNYIFNDICMMSLGTLRESDGSISVSDDDGNEEIKDVESTQQHPEVTEDFFNVKIKEEELSDLSDSESSDDSDISAEEENKLSMQANILLEKMNESKPEELKIEKCHSSVDEKSEDPEIEKQILEIFGPDITESPNCPRNADEVESQLQEIFGTDEIDEPTIQIPESVTTTTDHAKEEHKENVPKDLETKEESTVIVKKIGKNKRVFKTKLEPLVDLTCETPIVRKIPKLEEVVEIEDEDLPARNHQKIISKTQVTTYDPVSNTTSQHTTVKVEDIKGDHEEGEICSDGEDRKPDISVSSSVHTSILVKDDDDDEFVHSLIDSDTKPSQIVARTSDSIACEDNLSVDSKTYLVKTVKKIEKELFNLVSCLKEKERKHRKKKRNKSKRRESRKKSDVNQLSSLKIKSEPISLSDSDDSNSKTERKAETSEPSASSVANKPLKTESTTLQLSEDIKPIKVEPPIHQPQAPNLPSLAVKFDTSKSSSTENRTGLPSYPTPLPNTQNSEEPCCSKSLPTSENNSLQLYRPVKRRLSRSKKRSSSGSSTSRSRSRSRSPRGKSKKSRSHRSSRRRYSTSSSSSSSSRSYSPKHKKSRYSRSRSRSRSRTYSPKRSRDRFSPLRKLSSYSSRSRDRRRESRYSPPTSSSQRESSFVKQISMSKQVINERGGVIHEEKTITQNHIIRGNREYTTEVTTTCNAFKNDPFKNDLRSFQHLVKHGTNRYEVPLDLVDISVYNNANVNVTKNRPNGDLSHPFYIHPEDVELYTERLKYSPSLCTQALHEICTKCKWNMPTYFQFQEGRGFKYSMKINDHRFLVTKGAPTKKIAKQESAKLVLQWLCLMDPKL